MKVPFAGSDALTFKPGSDGRGLIHLIDIVHAIRLQLDIDRGQTEIPILIPLSAEIRPAPPMSTRTTTD
jgi:hypothetical protein